MYRQPTNDTKTNSTNVSVFLDLRFLVRVSKVRNWNKCRYFGSRFTLHILHNTLPITNTRGGHLLSIRWYKTSSSSYENHSLSTTACEAFSEAKEPKININDAKNKTKIKSRILFHVASSHIAKFCVQSLRRCKIGFINITLQNQSSYQNLYLALHVLK